MANKDLATLLTCTPYGVNTERLIVTGVLTKMPGWTKKTVDTGTPLVRVVLAGLWVVGITATLIGVRHWKKEEKIC